MMSVEQAKKMVAVKKLAEELGVCCKNCKYWHFVEHDEISRDIGGCSRVRTDMRAYDYCSRKAEWEYCNEFFWKE